MSERIISNIHVALHSRRTCIACGRARRVIWYSCQTDIIEQLITIRDEAYDDYLEFIEIDSRASEIDDKESLGRQPRAAMRII